MARAIDSETAYQFLTDQLVTETGAFSRGVNKGLNIARSAMRNTDAIPTLSPWVSVEERLPDKPGHYLICTNVNYWHGGCMDKNEEHKYHESGTPIGYFGTTMSVLDCYYDITGDWNKVYNCHVTHWMPLPAPPDRRPPEGEEDV